MKRRRFRPGLLLLAGFAALGARPAVGEPITFMFSGELTRVFDENGVLNGEVQVGAALDGTYTFESTTPDARANDPENGLYEGTISDMTGHVFGSAGPLLFSRPKTSEH